MGSELAGGEIMGRMKEVFMEIQEQEMYPFDDDEYYYEEYRRESMRDTSILMYDVQREPMTEIGSKEEISGDIITPF